MAWNVALAPTLRLAPSRSDSVSSLASSSSSSSSLSSSSFCSHHNNCKFGDPYPSLSTRPQRTISLQSYAFQKKEKELPIPEYPFPDPIPEFAEAEAEKFRTHLLGRLSKRTDIYGDKVDEVLQICTEILSTFLHEEYQGPGSLMVDPFMDMAEALSERELPGGPQAARTAVKWAQEHVDKDWNEWTVRLM